ncbi:FecCD family ABC transporter permease [Janthinobacterium agaricidamnosum]|uniref:FecCD transport family protein n=1 Tax=Janthinobacterium agaricidamnosum NBRC 102515 = DSM 9628 TaxID=1349767 RepID=W0V8N0_9BURK|nr:iron ABC transporter permease [Janthinobacterium agaricidamnosum]CDG83713.1 fecCD transport family protein [Janthinobacterium agaricidamnosum NBRC 102515 = DSM 9628]
MSAPFAVSKELPAPLEPGLHAWRRGGVSLLYAGRSLWVTGVLCLLLAATVGLGLMAGSSWISPQQLLALLRGEGAPGMQLLVLEFRLPRLLVGLLAGMALGLAGCLVQALTRNRLATPDLLGVADGATLGVFVALIGSASGMFGPWWVGPLGALGAVVLLLIAAGNLGRRGQRLLIVGLALASLLRAVTELALSRQELMHASALYAWSIGSLNGRGYAAAAPLAAGLLLLLPLTLLCSRRLALLRFDLEIAGSLGLPVRTTQWQALLTAVLLAGLAVGVCGPIAFVALAAPFVAERLVGGGRIALFSAALVGALLVSGADTLGRVLLSAAELPVGVICNLLGGPFLLWLLLSERNKEM